MCVNTTDNLTEVSKALTHLKHKQKSSYSIQSESSLFSPSLPFSSVFSASFSMLSPFPSTTGFVISTSGTTSGKSLSFNFPLASFVSLPSLSDTTISKYVHET